jgi:hypothetical protein
MHVERALHRKVAELSRKQEELSLPRRFQVIDASSRRAAVGAERGEVQSWGVSEGPMVG